jgi:hypothetical protein
VNMVDNLRVNVCVPREFLVYWIFKCNVRFIFGLLDVHFRPYYASHLCFICFFQ